MRRSKHNKGEKIEACERYLSNKDTMPALAEEYEVNTTTINVWVQKLLTAISSKGILKS